MAERSKACPAIMASWTRNKYNGCMNSYGSKANCKVDRSTREEGIHATKTCTDSYCFVFHSDFLFCWTRSNCGRNHPGQNLICRGSSASRIDQHGEGPELFEDQRGKGN